MLNKRVGTLLALVLASSMVLSGPAAVLASSRDSGETSQTETTDTREEKDGEDQEDEKDEGVSADAEKDKKAKAKKNKQNISKNNVSSEQIASDSDSEDKVKEKDLTEEEGQAESLPEADGSDEEAEESLPRASVSDDESISDNNSPSENKGTGSFKLSDGAQDGVDYEYDADADQLTLKSDKAMTISGTVSQGSILVDSAKGADLTFENLHMKASGTALSVSRDTGAVRLRLKGQNELTRIRINNSARVTIEGPGVLKSDAGQANIGSSSQPVVVSGGNIQALFSPGPVNEDEAPLYPVSINKLEKGREYSIHKFKVENVSGNYSYGRSIIADGNGKIVMYLPAGKVQLALDSDSYNYQGTVLSDNDSELERVVTPSPTNAPVTDSPTPIPTATPTVVVSGNQANPADNGLYWINSGATYRSGASLQFYATGAGYGPEEPQQLYPLRNDTRYVPVSWSVASTSTGSSDGASGSWKKKDREVTTGRAASTNNGSYVSGEYRFKDSFVLSTNLASAVPYTLTVSYQQETYNGRKWVANANASATKSVSFYIRNVDITGTGTPRPTGTTWGTRVTSTASRTGISSNARNARTSDETPIGTMIFLMFAAAGSGAVIFRKKMRS